MTAAPPTQYARTAEGAYLAYQCFGKGPIDLVLPLNGGLGIDLVWDEPAFVSFFTRLATFARVIALDVRGFGSSSRVDPNRVPAVQTWMDDVATVMDAARSEQASMVAHGECAMSLMLFAATYPERVDHLVLANPYTRYIRNDECPWAMPADVHDAYMQMYRDLWGSGEVARWLAPSLVPNDEALARWGRIERLAATPDVVTVPMAFARSDVTDVLPSIQAPTLVVVRTGDRHVRPEHGRYVASRIPHARLLEVGGEDDVLAADPTPELLDAIEEFVTGIRPTPVLERVLSTVLFTDIVSSTTRAAAVGDRAWRDALDQFDALSRQMLRRFRGTYVKSTGDGTLATFDGPARAVECARSIAAAMPMLGLEIRAGLHTGEIERRGDDVAGLAVHIAARVAALAAGGQVLVSRTVTDLVAGSGIAFDDLGEHELKGVPGTWRLYAAEAGS